MTARERVTVLLAVLLVVLGAAGIGAVQPALARSVKKVKQKDDTTAIPPPAQLRAMTFGYRAAAADYLWASLLVEHGIHSQENRTFPGVTAYLDGILALDPEHPTLYRFVDTLLMFPPGQVATEADARTARAYLERGTRERPLDHEVWLQFGQFLAFLAPSFLKEDAEIERWRRDGALAIAKAIELGASADRSLSAASILSRAGETNAAIQQLQRAYALTDDPDTRHQILLKLSHLKASLQVESTVGLVEHEWRSRYPFLSRGTALLIGPHRDAAACAGRETVDQHACADDWTRATAEP